MRVEMVVLFSVASVCLSVRLSVNTIILEQLVHHRMFERADMFENGYVVVHGWWFNISAVLVCENYFCYSMPFHHSEPALTISDSVFC